MIARLIHFVRFLRRRKPPASIRVLGVGIRLNLPPQPYHERNIT